MLETEDKAVEQSTYALSRFGQHSLPAAAVQCSALARPAVQVGALAARLVAPAAASPVQLAHVPRCAARTLHYERSFLLS